MLSHSYMDHIKNSLSKWVAIQRYLIHTHGSHILPSMHIQIDDHSYRAQLFFTWMWKNQPFLWKFSRLKCQGDFPYHSIAILVYLRVITAAGDKNLSLKQLDPVSAVRQQGEQWTVLQRITGCSSQLLQPHQNRNIWFCLEIWV